MSLSELIKCGDRSKPSPSGGATAAALALLEREPELAKQMLADGSLPLHLSLVQDSEDALVLKLLDLHPEAARHPDKNSNRPINIAMAHGRGTLVVSRLLAA